ncbi:hypothetical protein PJ900_04270 (plasmid) [Tistrella mobilis]|uniref:Uncharacterized protein n=1 Tax=Tistrella mobilis TaxID=171437 RepID=A0A162KWR6_9PROT|nr:hypothetical protein [Tistrella mobilis]KYO52330.1 hypothetical protein AUP44_00855 [Tistrella mobilis]
MTQPVTFDDIDSVLSTGSFTSNNDAVLALAIPQLNQFLATQFVSQISQDGLNPMQTLQSACAGASPSQLLVLDVTTGPSLIDFSSDGGSTVTLSTLMISGFLGILNWTQPRIEYLIDLAGSYGNITGTMPLSVVTGDVSGAGTVSINSATATSWTVDIDGMPAGSPACDALQAAVAAYYAANPYNYVLGQIEVPDDAAEWVTPTAFDFQVVTTDGQGAALVNPYLAINIITSTAGAAPQQVTGVELIPSGQTAALLIRSGLVVENEIVAALNANTGLTTLGCSFAATYQNGDGNAPWTVATTSGTGQTDAALSVDVDGYGLISCNSNDMSAPVAFPLAGVTQPLQVTPFPLTLSLKSNWGQYWGHTVRSGYDTLSGPESMTATLSQSYEISITGNSTITISASPTSIQLDPQDVTSDATTFDVGTAFANSITTVLQNLGNSATFTGVDTFCLDSLAFPAGGLIQLNQADLPCDLYATGQITPALAMTIGGVVVNPIDVTTLGPGQQATFGVSTATGTTTVYSVVPADAPATIDSAGVLTVDSTISQPSLIVVAAEQTVSGAAPIYGAALVSIQPQSAAYRINPGSVVVPAKGKASFTIVDDDGNLYAASSTLATTGSISYEGSTQTFTYTAGDDAGPVTLTALVGSGSSAVTISADWNIATVADPTVTASASEVQVGGSAVTITATVPETVTLNTLRWTLVDSTNTTVPPPGTLTPSSDDVMSATYTPPASFDDTVNQNINVIAWYMPSDVATGGPALGAGATYITLQPASGAS